ncbi:unnamed protein product [Fusarium graminearum]|nr:unnamed protein product [Fusarium graminearum]CAG1975993.1 unnamed protein product [Fusarium graminearum]VTO87587.1 unnamed protein product [Fusarium graminearum]
MVLFFGLCFFETTQEIASDAQSSRVKNKSKSKSLVDEEKSWSRKLKRGRETREAKGKRDVT